MGLMKAVLEPAWPKVVLLLDPDMPLEGMPGSSLESSASMLNGLLRFFLDLTFVLVFAFGVTLGSPCSVLSLSASFYFHMFSKLRRIASAISSISFFLLLDFSLSSSGSESVLSSFLFFF